VRLVVEEMGVVGLSMVVCELVIQKRWMSRSLEGRVGKTERPGRANAIKSKYMRAIDLDDESYLR
jgi:hypothetical protein